MVFPLHFSQRLEGELLPFKMIEKDDGVNVNSAKGKPAMQ